jgi:hypothetical protein
MTLHAMTVPGQCGMASLPCRFIIGDKDFIPEQQWTLSLLRWDPPFADTSDPAQGGPKVMSSITATWVWGGDVINTVSVMSLASSCCSALLAPSLVNQHVYQPTNHDAALPCVPYTCVTHPDHGTNRLNHSSLVNCHA